MTARCVDTIKTTHGLVDLTKGCVSLSTHVHNLAHARSSLLTCALHAPTSFDIAHVVAPRSVDSGVRTTPASDRAFGVAQVAERNDGSQDFNRHKSGHAHVF